jgi:hypothetical protein
MSHLGRSAFVGKLFGLPSRDALTSARESWHGRIQGTLVHFLQVLSKTTPRRRRYRPNCKIMSILKPAFQSVDRGREKLKPHAVDDFY